ncbi:MAG: VCBS repeat-containing protein [Saprospiraceae bacterium]|nr:VCBS repeat-containing protein [Saprospiraceae bacterium]
MKSEVLLVGSIVLTCVGACKPRPVALVQTGEALSKIHCASCHAYPEPSLLDKSSWERYVLPRMGQMLGVLPLETGAGSFIEPEAKDLAFQNPLIFRKESLLSAAEWEAIRDFYVQNAPASTVMPLPVLDMDLAQFEVVFPDYFLSPPSVTMVKMADRRLYVGDANSKRLYEFDASLRLQKSALAGEGVVGYHRLPHGEIVGMMGSFSPTDLPVGQLLFFPSARGELPKVLIDSLKRPVHIEVADLDGDGRLDFVVSEFAKWTGSLCWWQNAGNDHFVRHLLRDMPGAIRTAVHDFDADGLPDIMALFGQGDEGIFIYYNRGNGHFEEQRVLRFPASYGSSYFTLFDYDGDPHPDIIYTCGDNADFPSVYKPYHGIRIFQNNGRNQFKEVFFYPMPGAYGAVPHDFDMDGDWDIAAISFFPDFKTAPAQAFVFLENKGNNDFKARTFPAVNKGRWLVMDAGDLDGDGDWDIVLGALTMQTIPETGLVAQWVKDGIPFVLLRNKAR